MCKVGIWGSEVMASVILNLGTKWDEWSASHPDSFIPQGKAPVLNQRLGQLHSWLECFAKEKIFFPCGE